MKKLEVEVLSKLTVTPSSPTPRHLRRHNLSFLDQLAPHVYIPFLYFYSQPKTDPTQILIQSLSKTLTLYYPLAGRLKLNDLFVHCNDSGVPFHLARVETASLYDVIGDPCLSDMHTLLPFRLDELTEVPFGVQVTLFRCGGVAVGLCASHRVADALSFLTFVKSWAGNASAGCGDGEAIVKSPDFSAALVFPQRNMGGYKGAIVAGNEVVTKGFVFDGRKIEALRRMYAERIGFKKKRPSRVEALSAFLWDKFLNAAAEKEEAEEGGSIGSRKMYTVVYIMDLRSRFDPPLPQHSFGNYYRAATATPTLANGEERGSLVRQVIEEIEKIDEKYMTKFQDGYKDHLEFMRRRMERAAKGELVTLTFSSLCRFPLYDADFGWGKPTWVSMASMKVSNQIVFMDTKLGDGIESYFSFKEEDMAKFQLDPDFLELISPIGNVKISPFARL